MYLVRQAPEHKKVSSNRLYTVIFRGSPIPNNFDVLADTACENLPLDLGPYRRGMASNIANNPARQYQPYLVRREELVLPIDRSLG